LKLSQAIYVFKIGIRILERPFRTVGSIFNMVRVFLEKAQALYSRKALQDEGVSATVGCWIRNGWLRSDLWRE